MFSKRVNNRSGIIMVTVIAVILMMSILLAGIFSRNISSSISSIDQAKGIRADLLARGAYWVAYNRLRSNQALVGWAETIDNIRYDIGFNRTGNRVDVQVTYPQ